MGTSKAHKLIVVGIGLLLIYLLAHWGELWSPYTINDDVRQQIYWMQQWQDSALYQNHLLTDYAKQYVPWGVQALYWVASQWISPLLFSKILGMVLFVVSGMVLFLLASRLGDELTAFAALCLYLYLGLFLGSVAGGLSRGFVFPLLLLYLYFLAGNKVFKASVVVMMQPLFNPYLFLLCLVSHSLYLLHIWWKSGVRPAPSKDGGQTQVAVSRLLLFTLPVVVGLLLLFAKYKIFSTADFGTLVSYSDMIGRVEYTSLGRYEILPVPSIAFELIRPLLQFLPNGVVPVSAGGVGLIILLFVAGSVRNLPRMGQQFQKMGLLLYLLVASLLLYLVARLMLMDLFLPSRYLEYSLTVIYCLAGAILLRSGMETVRFGERGKKVLATLLLLLGALRLYGQGSFDYSQYTPLYSYFQTIPKNVLVAGHPKLMDNVLTFGQRKVYVSYELSHTWYSDYWAAIKARTYQFFRAYYAEDPAAIIDFCQKNRVDYFVVRDEDFSPTTKNKPVYFEPFGTYIESLKAATNTFAAIEGGGGLQQVYKENEIRVLLCSRPYDPTSNRSHQK